MRYPVCRACLSILDTVLAGLIAILYAVYQGNRISLVGPEMSGYAYSVIFL